MKETLIGEYDETGYRIVSDTHDVVYEAGNNPHDSSPTQSLPVGQGADLEQILMWCDHTGREMAGEREAEWNGVRYVGTSIEVKSTTIVELERMKDLLIGAFEGGSNYWAGCDEWQVERRRDGEDVYDLIIRDHTVSYPFYDVEDNEQLGKLNFEGMKRALQFMANGRDKNDKPFPMRHWQAFIDENDDAETADVFLQLAIMGEIVYG